MRGAPVLASATAGVAAVLGFSPFGFALAPVLGLALWFGQIVAAAPGAAAVRGYAFGLGYFGAGVSWIQVSAHQFGVPVYAFSVGVTLGFVAFLAAYPALSAWFAARLVPAEAGRGARLALLVPAFVLGEGLRGYLFTGFPWLAVGYSQTAGPLRGYAPLVGTYGLSLAVATAAALAVLLVLVPVLRRRALAGLALLVAGGLLAGRVEFTRPAGEPFAVAIVQGNVPQARKWLPSERPRTLRRYLALSERALEAGADVVIWPETAIPAFADEVPEVLEALRAIAVDSKATFLVGVPRRLPVPGAPDARPMLFNSVVELGASGMRWYDKRHLVPFGEYLPLEGLIRAPLANLGVRLADFAPGPDDQALLRAGGHALGMSICYEDVFAREVNRSLPDAHYLVNVSNDAWFGNSLAPHQHMQIARMRALETGRMMVRATNTGISAVAEHRGRLVAASPQFETDVLVAEVLPRRGVTPYLALGDAGVLAGVAGLCVLALVATRRRVGRLRGSF